MKANTVPINCKIVFSPETRKKALLGARQCVVACILLRRCGIAEEVIKNVMHIEMGPDSSGSALWSFSSLTIIAALIRDTEVSILL